MVSSHSGTPLGVGTSHGHFGPQDTPRPGLGGSHHLTPYSILCDTPPRLHPNDSFSQDSQVGVPELWQLITPDCQVWSRRDLNQTYSPRRDLSNDVSHSQFGRREEVDSQLFVLPALLLPITWARDVQMTDARRFSISTFQDLSNDTKNTPMRGVLGLAIEL